MGHLRIIHIVTVIFVHFFCQASGFWQNYYTSTYGEICYDSCRNVKTAYFWCNTRKGWDYCSLSDRDYKGLSCQKDYPCGKYGNTYYSCKNTIGKWSYCGVVEPKNLLYLSSTYQEICTDDCSYDNRMQYFWCHTKKGWDYCSPFPNITYANERCRTSSRCDTHGYYYSWCYTSYSWDYCGLILPNECKYNINHRGKRQLESTDLICAIDNLGHRTRTTLRIDRRAGTFADGSSMTNETQGLIADWNNALLRLQARSGLATSQHLRIDQQGMVNRAGEPYYNLQIQFNARRRPGSSTTVAQVLIPANVVIPDRYVRRAFWESFQRGGTVFVDVQPICAVPNK